MNKIGSILAVGLLLLAASAQGQVERNQGVITSSLYGLEYQVRAGFNFGGAAPVPLPREIRSIDGFSPGLHIAIEGNVTKWFGAQQRWGAIVGLRAENKGMETNATVKNYSMELIGDGGEKTKGNWTGGVLTKVRNAYLSVPILVAYKLNNRVRFSAGPFLSFMMDGEFTGYVYDGYLREINPVGTKVLIEGDNRPAYDFSSELRSFQWGLQAGTKWRALKHLDVCADLTWGLNDIFRNDFQTITFAMYPIYLNLGFGYVF